MSLRPYGHYQKPILANIAAASIYCVLVCYYVVVVPILKVLVCKTKILFQRNVSTLHKAQGIK